jgi:hypothetical protein
MDHRARAERNLHDSKRTGAELPLRALRAEHNVSG